MPGWIIAAGLGSIALTALLTFVLWRLNAPANERAAKRDSSDGAVFPIIVGGADHNADGTFDGVSDGGSGGDGGGGK